MLIDQFKKSSILIYNLIILSLILSQTFTQVTRSLQFSILPSNPLLPQATIGVPYQISLSINPSSVNISEVAFTPISILPQGLKLQSSGVITGTPTVSGNYSLIIQAQIPSALTQVIANYSLNIKTLEFVNFNIPKVKLGIPFSITLQIIGGVFPLSWIYMQLPTWATGNGALLFGTPTSSGTFPFTVIVRDSKNNTISKNFQLQSQQINQSSITLKPTQIIVTANVLYSQQLIPSGGSPPYVIQFPNKPVWLSYTQNQIKILIPSIGTYSFPVQIIDSKGSSQLIKVKVNSVNEQTGLIDYMNKAITHIVDPKTGVKMIIYNTTWTNNIDSKDPPLTKKTVNSRPNPQTRQSQLIYSQISFIKDKFTYNPNKPPCRLQTNTSSSIGIIKSINYLDSKVTLNDNRVLQFQNCTKQAFRSTSNSFKIGDSITFAGNPKNQQQWFLFSISNLS